MTEDKKNPTTFDDRVVFRNRTHSKTSLVVRENLHVKEKSILHDVILKGDIILKTGENLQDALNKLSIGAAGAACADGAAGAACADGAAGNSFTTVTDDVLPSVSNTYSLGSPEARFKELYLSEGTLYTGITTYGQHAITDNSDGGNTFGIYYDNIDICGNLTVNGDVGIS